MSSCRGYSLSELLVSLALISIAIGAAWQLWGDAIRLTEAAGRSMLDASETPAVILLRHDIQAALAAPDPCAWRSSPLVLAQAGELQVSYQLDRGGLSRCCTLGAGAADPGGKAETCQPLVRPLAGWQWRVPAPGLVEVQMELERAADPYTAATGNRIGGHAPRTLQRCTLRAAVRLDRPGALGW